MKLISTQCNAYYACYLKCLTSQESHCTHYIDQANKRKKNMFARLSIPIENCEMAKLPIFKFIQSMSSGAIQKREKKCFAFVALMRGRKSAK